MSDTSPILIWSAALAACVITACGGSGDSPSGMAASLFVKREGDELQIGKQWYTP